MIVLPSLRARCASIALAAAAVGGAPALAQGPPSTPASPTIRAIVINRGPGWAGAGPVNSQRFPRLLVDVTADPSRDATGAITVSDAEDRAFAAAGVVIPLFTFPALRGERIGAVGSNPGLYVISSQLWEAPRLITVADLHGSTVMNQAAMGDTKAVRTEFALAISDG